MGCIRSIKQQDPEDRGVIEAPANAETIIYESPDGQQYEISISDLIEADDDDEIKYTAPKNQDYYKLKSSYKKTKKIYHYHKITPLFHILSLNKKEKTCKKMKS